jgi:hypothetical protein
MRAAAGAQAFELAGQIKQQLGFARRWLEEWAPRVRRDADLNVAMLVPATRRRAWTPFLFRTGCLTAGPLVRSRAALDDALDWLNSALGEAPPDTDRSLRMEQAWLVTQFCASDAANSSARCWFRHDAGAQEILAGVRTIAEKTLTRTKS